DPTALVLGISTAGIDTRFIDFCLERGAPFDVLTIHPYRSRLSELGLIRELRATAQQVGGRPVWITEMGWSTQVGATSERAQAELLARSYLASVASDACQNVSWYDFRSDGNDPFYNEHNFGVLHHDLTPKAGYRALATICTSLAGGDLRSVEGFGEDVFAVAVGDATAIWTASRDLAVEVQRAGQSRVQNLMGEVVPVPDESGAVRLPLRAGQPLFLLGSWAAPTGRTVQLPGGRTPELIRF
ncbi:hypothetical protein FJZ36_17075, partial [Candidatus Poribacteria bacterium]|nr:hypothetical protein [Candidatus Poribacteria bacterium]